MELGFQASPVSFFRSRSEETKGSTLVDLPATSKPVLGAERRRWYVHLALLTSLAGSLVSLIYLSHSITIHVIFGVLFMVMLIFHLYQRRRTVKALLKRLAGVEVRSKPSVRLALSDTILELLVVNVLVSGIVDSLRHQATQITFVASIGFPQGLAQWHKLGAILLVLYVIAHVIRRRRRLRRSHIQ